MRCRMSTLNNMSRSKGGRPPLRGSVTGNTPSINGRKASQSIMLASRGNRLFKALSRSMISCSSKRPLVGRCFMISKRSNAAGIVKILRGQVINKFLEVPKKLTFKYNETEKVNSSSQVVLQIKNGRLGYDVIESFYVK